MVMILHGMLPQLLALCKTWTMYLGSVGAGGQAAGQVLRSLDKLDFDRSQMSVVTMYSMYLHQHCSQDSDQAVVLEVMKILLLVDSGIHFPSNRCFIVFILLGVKYISYTFVAFLLDV
jgi:hypothetical protein